MSTRLAHLAGTAVYVISRWGNYVVAITTVAMMMLSVVNVLLRYAFNQPIKGVYEYTQMMMVIVVFIGLGYTALRKGHVNVDLVISRLPQRTRAVFENVTQAISIVLLSMIAWQGFERAEGLRLVNEIAGATGLPLYPFGYVVSFGCILMSLVIVVDLAHSLAGTAKRDWWQLGLWLISAGVVASAPWWLQQLPGGLSPLAVGGIGLVLLIIFLFSGLPIGIGLALVGFFGATYLKGPDTMLGILSTVPLRTAYSYFLSVLPLFVLMGALCYVGGLSKDLYFAARQWLGRLRGGLAMATIAGCAGFAAICGSSVATAVAMGTVSLPEMERYKYDSRLATGSIAAGGTLGILIPPSVGFIIYGLIVEQSIGDLFIAGILPGILLAGLFMLVVYILTKRNPSLGPPGPSVSLREKLLSTKGIWPVLVLFVLVIGGLYIGIFTPTEAGGVGAFGALIITLLLRRLTWQKFIAALDDTARITCMVFLILIGAMILGYFLTYTQVPSALATYAAGLALPRYVIFAAIFVIYLFLGCIMDSLAMIILTVPIFFPVIVALGFDPIWFGVIIVIIMEAGLITPPVGMNVYVISGVAKNVPMYTIFRGIVPFLWAMIICVVILTIFPQIVLVLPNLLKPG